jgi:hypothetical protein
MRVDYMIRVGVHNYGARRTLEDAIERAKFWSEQKPGVRVVVERRELMWDNGVTFDSGSVMRHA